MATDSETSALPLATDRGMGCDFTPGSLYLRCVPGSWVPRSYSSPEPVHFSELFHGFFHLALQIYVNE